MVDLRVHIGCGLVAPPTWINIDRSPNVLLDRFPPLKYFFLLVGALEKGHMRDWPRNIQRLDVTKGLPFESGSVSAVYSSHMLEHLYLNDAGQVLVECQRILGSSGILRLALPDSELLASDLLAGISDGFPDAGTRFNEGLNTFPASAPNRRTKVRSIFSANVHRWQPTRSILSRLLADAGFSRIVERGFREGDCPDMELVEHCKESIFVEAVT